MNRKSRLPVDAILPGPVRWFFYFFIRGGLWFLAKIFFRFSVTGSHHIPDRGAVVLVANHASFLDPIFLSIATRRWVHYWMYSAFYHSFAKPLFQYFCCIPVDEKQFLAAMKIGSRLLEHGVCLGVFPEGAVSYDGRLLDAKPGALFIAQRAGAPVVPVTLIGDHDVFPRGAWIPRLRKLRVVIGEPILIPKDLSREEVSEKINTFMSVFAKNLGQKWPPEDPIVFPPKEIPRVRYY